MDPGVIHTAIMSPLLPNTMYYYSVGDSNGVMTEQFSFRSHIGIGAAIAYQFVIFGDMVIILLYFEMLSVFVSTINNLLMLIFMYMFMFLGSITTGWNK
jgi:hypothetical protein